MEDVIPENNTVTTPTVQEIPLWIKGVFVYWSQGQITDSELMEAIKYLINTGILVL